MGKGAEGDPCLEPVWPTLHAGMAGGRKCSQRLTGTSPPCGPHYLCLLLPPVLIYRPVSTGKKEPCASWTGDRGGAAHGAKVATRRGQRSSVLPFPAGTGLKAVEHSPPSTAIDVPQEVGFMPRGKASGLSGAFRRRQGMTLQFQIGKDWGRGAGERSVKARDPHLSSAEALPHSLLPYGNAICLPPLL